jgi:putative aminopeptidase FrvX
MKPLDVNYIRQTVVRLANIPSVTGNTGAIMQAIEKEFADLGYASQLTTKGALLVTIPGIDSTGPRTLSAHVDTLGAMVKEIKSSGRLRITNIGGYM